MSSAWRTVLLVVIVSAIVSFIVSVVTTKVIMQKASERPKDSAAQPATVPKQQKEPVPGGKLGPSEKGSRPGRQDGN